MKLQDKSVQNIIENVIKSQDYRMEIVNLINSEFLEFAMDFFMKVVRAKLDAKDITIDWYKKAFLNGNLSADEIAINSGLNKKTVHNMYKTATKQVVLDASTKHFDALYNTIQTLVADNDELDLTLTIKMNKVSVDLSISESLIVINTLAVKRVALRGGAWSTVGKQVEKSLMLTLCNLFKVPKENYNAEHFVKDKNLKVDREVDFYLINGDKKFRCEVKLMGKGNPESADAIIARDSDIFVADTLSEQNKNQCDKLGVEWICLRDADGYKKFGNVLEKFGIPHEKYSGDLDKDLPKILSKILGEKNNSRDTLF